MSHNNGSFVLSKPPPLSWNRSSIQNFFLSKDQVIQTLKAGNAASIITVDFNLELVIGYCPLLTNDDHGNPERIFFSLSDRTKSENFGYVNVAELGLFAAVDENDIPNFSKNKKLTRNHLKGTHLDKTKNWVAAVLPNFILLPHGVKPPTYTDFSGADLSELKNSHGDLVFTILSQLQKAGNDTHLSRSTDALNNITDASDGTEYVSDFFDDNEIILLDKPFVTFSATSNLHDEASKLRDIFKIPPTPPPLQQPNHSQNIMHHPTNITFGLDGSTTNPAQGQIVVVSQDAKEKADRKMLADKITEAKRSIMFMTGTINKPPPGSTFGSVSVSNLSVPTWRVNFSNLANKPKGEVREAAAHRYFQHGVTMMKANGDKLNRLTAHDIGVLSRAMTNATYHANYSTAPLEDLMGLPSTKQLNIMSFGPQSRHIERTKAINDANQRVQSDALMDLPEGERSKTSTSIDSFPSDGSVDDVEMSLLNIHLLHHLQCDFTAGMPLVTQTLANLRDIITDQLDWIRKNKEHMPWLGTVFLVKAQNIISGFAGLSDDYTLLESLSEQVSSEVLRRAITQNTMEHIVSLVTIPHSFAAEIARAKANNCPLSDQIFRPSFYSERQVNTSINADTLAHGGKRPLSASAEKQEETRSTLNRIPRTRPSVSNRKTRDKLGLLYLSNPEMPPQRIFPQGNLTFKNRSGAPCVGFCCQGKICDRTATTCKFLHFNNYDALGQEYFDKLCAHLDENNHGWLSDGMIQKSNRIKLKLQYDHLRGDENGPYTSKNEG